MGWTYLLNSNTYLLILSLWGAFFIEAQSGAAVDRCLLPEDIGPCRAIHYGFFRFDPKSRRCVMFPYGGCSGNPNLFESLSACHEACRHLIPEADIVQGHHLASEKCLASPLLPSGPDHEPVYVSCFGVFPRFTFDPKSLQCVPYIYGGCNAGPNLYLTLTQCENTCLPGAREILEGFSDRLPFSAAACQPGSVSPSRLDGSPRWHRDPTSEGDCVLHQPSVGCFLSDDDDTDNLFETKEACDEASRSLKQEVASFSAKPAWIQPSFCRQPALSASSKLETEGEYNKSCVRYTYNVESGRCVTFIDPRSSSPNNQQNVFLNHRDCLRTCNLPAHMKATPNVCGLPIDMGTSCVSDSSPFYGFNSNTGRCEAFIYKGCGGNHNRFEVLEECVNTCGGISEPQTNPLCSIVKCNPYEMVANRAKGCVPITQPDECCPSSWDCSLWEERLKRRDECFTADLDNPNGKFYQIGDEAPEVSYKCRVGCRCSQRIRGVAEFVCAVMDCSIWLTPFDNKACVYVYSPNKCCPDAKCGAERDSLFTCELEGKTYYEGQTMSPKQEACRVCYCKPGWNGTMSEEFCHNVKCFLDDSRLAQGCHPIFMENICCPIDWVCPVISEWLPDPIFSEMVICPPGVEVKHNHLPTEVYPDFLTQMISQGPSNPNRFSPRTMRPMSDVCLLPKSLGPCYGYQKRWYFDIVTRKCHLFMNGGSRHGNVFNTRFDCESTCQKYLYFTDTKGTPSCQEAAVLPPASVVDKCIPIGRRFRYDPATNVCVETTKEGCRRNQNSFIKKEACESMCVSVEAPVRYPKPGRAPNCAEDVQIGHCKSRLKRFYYHHETGKCHQFYFSGCAGTNNNFVTQRECENTCVISGAGLVRKASFSVISQQEISPPVSPSDSCKDDFDRGMCYAIIPRYYFDPISRTCSLFAYGGCHGSKNNFRTKDECSNTCPIDPTKNAMTPLEICSMPKKVGPCKAAVPSFYYDPSDNSCKRFVYSGCGGNQNNFRSYSDCELNCKLMSLNIHSKEVMETVSSTRDMTDSYQSVALADKCLLDPEVGLCRAHMRKTYYNHKMKRCDEFIYGGCGGNENKFSSKEECESECGKSVESVKDRVIRAAALVKQADSPPASDDVCSLAPETGLCRAYMISWYYNSSTDTCEKFIYGGCRGNANRFTTEETCLAQCKKKETEVPDHAMRIATSFLSPDIPEDPIGVCKFGNFTYYVGDTARSSINPCRKCICSSPPNLLCFEKVCSEPNVADGTNVDEYEPVYDEDGCCIVSYKFRADGDRVPRKLINIRS